MSLCWLRQGPFAHRGFHDLPSGRPENGLGAVEAALGRGFGIEIDVRASSDGEAIVFHDDDLGRMTEAKGPLAARPASALTALRLRGSQERVPTLAAVLDLVAGRVGLLVEIKAGARRPGALEARVASLLAAYDGPAAAMSFEPASIAFLAETAPAIRRGLVACPQDWLVGMGLAIHERVLLQHLLMRRHARPDFIAYAGAAAHRPAPQLARAEGLPLLAWTVRSREEARRLRPHVDALIFEGFDPGAWQP